MKPSFELLAVPEGLHQLSNTNRLRCKTHARTAYIRQWVTVVFVKHRPAIRFRPRRFIEPGRTSQMEGV